MRRTGVGIGASVVVENKQRFVKEELFALAHPNFVFFFVFGSIAVIPLKAGEAGKTMNRRGTCISYKYTSQASMRQRGGPCQIDDGSTSVAEPGIARLARSRPQENPPTEVARRRRRIWGLSAPSCDPLRPSANDFESPCSGDTETEIVGGGGLVGESRRIMLQVSPGGSPTPRAPHQGRRIALPVLDGPLGDPNRLPGAHEEAVIGAGR